MMADEQSGQCTLCPGAMVRSAKAGCGFLACRRCCKLVQRSNGMTCDVHPPEKERSVAASAKSEQGWSSVVFPQTITKLNVANEYLLFCPWSFMDFHIRSGRGSELVAAKLNQFKFEVAATVKGALSYVKSSARGKGGKEQKKSKGVDGKYAAHGVGGGGDRFASVSQRDVHEVESLTKIIDVILESKVKSTVTAIATLMPICERMFLLMILKKTGGIELVRRFEDITETERLPSSLRRATSLAKRTSTGSAGGGTYQKTETEKLRKKFRKGDVRHDHDDERDDSKRGEAEESNSDEDDTDDSSDGSSGAVAPRRRADGGDGTGRTARTEGAARTTARGDGVGRTAAAEGAARTTSATAGGVPSHPNGGSQSTRASPRRAAQQTPATDAAATAGQ
jgi:hypothetical protein